MLSREDFVFTIGYDGPAAVVDNQAKKKYGKLSTRELAEKGLFRAAYSSAVYSKDPGEIQFVAEAYKRLVSLSLVPAAGPGSAQGEAASPGVNLSGMDRLFGVFPVDVTRSIFL